MGNTQTTDIVERSEYISYSAAKRESQRRVEGYGEIEEQALADLNRKCIKKGYDQITIRENSDQYNCGERFKNRKNVTIAYVF